MGQRARSKTDEDSSETILQQTTFNGKLDQYSYSSTTTATTETTYSPTKRITRSHSSRLLTPRTPAASTIGPGPESKPPLIPTPPLSTTTTSTTTSTPTPRRQKRKRPTSSTTTPHTSPTKYADHPNHLTDALGPSLVLLFIGANPGLTTAATGHAYAHPSNLFWKLLHAAHLTPSRRLPADTHALPARYGLGNTNVVGRATRNASELSRAEMEAGVARLEEKVGRWRPEAVCVVGKGVWEAVWRVRRGRGFRAGEFGYGWQQGDGVGERMGVVEGEWGGARVFVATSTSGLAAGMGWAEKVGVWKPLGEWVCARRRERGLAVGGGGEGGAGTGGVDEAEEKKSVVREEVDGLKLAGG